MPETKYFLDAAGLARFKTKQDAANEGKFLGINAKAKTAGAADTAAKLAAAVAINGVLFDGSKAITIEDGTKLSIADAEKLYLKKATADTTYLPLHGTAEKATKLANQVKINGVLFDGSADITVEDATKLPIDGKANSATTADTAAEATHAAAADTATKLAAAVTINGVDFDGSKAITINAEDATPRIAASEKGAVNGVATLDAAGKVPAAQLPSYVDDVKEYENKAAFPETGEADKIYVDIDTGSIYRWSGTQYIQINASVASADTAVKLATARKIAGVPFDGTADITIPAGNVGAFTKEETTTTFLSKADATTTYVAITPGKDLSDNNFTTELLTKLNGIEEGANKYVLPQASSTTLGGVTVGSNITVKTGTISLAKENVIAALGYTPSDSAAEVPVEAISDSEIDKLFTGAAEQ